MALKVLSIPAIIDGMITSETDEERGIWSMLLGQIYFPQGVAIKEEKFTAMLEQLPEDIVDRIRAKMITVQAPSIIDPSKRVQALKIVTGA